jgi:superfamily II DNA or RNA helicase
MAIETHTGLALRPYQQDALDAVDRALATNTNRCLIAIPTGSGKTVIFAHQIARRPGRSLVLVHRDELISQAAAKLAVIVPDVEVGRVKAADNAINAECVLASVQTLSRPNRLAQLGTDFSTVIVDECVTGDTLIVTDCGEVPIRDIPASGCQRVLSYDGSHLIWSSLEAFLPQGTRPVLEIRLENGRLIKCTANHPIYTQHGWMAAGDLATGMRILFLVGADAESFSVGIAISDSANSSRITKSDAVLETNGLGCSTKSAPDCRSVPVAVGNKFGQPAAPWNGSSNGGAVAATADTWPSTTSDRPIGHLSWIISSDRPSWVPYWEIPVFCSPMTEAPTLGSLPTMARSSERGWRTKLHSSLGWIVGSQKLRVPGLGTSQSRCEHLVSRVWNLFVGWWRRTERNRFPGNGWTRLGGWVSPGGSATMVVPGPAVSPFTLRDSLESKFKLQQTGLQTTTVPRQYMDPLDAGISISESWTRPDANSIPKSLPTSRNAWNISSGLAFVPITAIRHLPPEPVYDLSVDSTHCFFANGTLVHNCHHSTANSYRRILERIGSFTNPNLLTLGVTATPDRSDGIGLKNVFQQIVYSRSILEMIEEGYLCDLRGMRIMIDADFSKLKVRAGEFSDAESAEILTEAHAPEVVAAAIQRHAADRKIIVFVPSVALAYETAAAISEHMPAEAVCGTTPTDERRATLDRLALGETRVLVNVGVLTEGYDEPSVDCIVLARPVRSRSLYTQMVGRGFRLFPGKDDCLVMDIVGATERLDLMALPTLFGLDLRDDTVLEAAEKAKEAAAEEQQRRLEMGEVVAEAVDLLGNRKLHWVPNGAGYVLSIPDGRITLDPIGRRAEDRWSVMEHTYRPIKSKVELAHDLPLGYAQGTAEDRVRKLGSLILVDEDAPWRNRPASDKQIDLILNLGWEPQDGITAGQASDMITRGRNPNAPRGRRRKWNPTPGMTKSPTVPREAVRIAPDSYD